MKNVIFSLMVIFGALIVLFSNFQTAIGVLLVAVGYTELRKQGYSLSDIDDIVKAKVNELLNK